MAAALFVRSRTGHVHLVHRKGKKTRCGRPLESGWGRPFRPGQPTGLGQRRPMDVCVRCLGGSL